MKPARPWLGLSAFWATVVKVELTDLVFAVDSILVAVAMSPKTWVVVSGGVVGIVMMRLVIGRLLVLVRRYPALVDGAFVIVAWVGLKLLFEFLRAHGLIDFEVSRGWSFGLIVVIFLISYAYARRLGPVDTSEDDEAADLLTERNVTRMTDDRRQMADVECQTDYPIQLIIRHPPSPIRHPTAVLVICPRPASARATCWRPRRG